MLRRLLRNRFLLPAAVLLAVGLAGVVGLTSGVDAQRPLRTAQSSHTAGTPVPAAAPATTGVAATRAATDVTAIAAATPVPAEYTVVPGDTLWSIAERFYGDGAEWATIAQDNLGRTMAGGVQFADPSVILPGWVLGLPRPPGAVTAAAGTGAATLAASVKVVMTAKTGAVLSVTGARTKSKAAKAATACREEIDKVSYKSPRNSGSPKTSSRIDCVDGRLKSYGSAAITYTSPPRSYVTAGEALFEQNCSSCHEADAQGGPAAPSLIGVGPATVDFWVTTGRMPAATPLSTQAVSKPPKLTNRQAEKIAAFITSLSPAAPFIPTVHLKHANLATGATLFALNCAACHTITGMGDELAYGTFAPSLHSVTPTQIAEAIRTGPGNMPRFTGNLSDSQVRNIVAYVTEKIQHPTNRGGFGLGGIGPVAEGFVALLFGVGGLMLVCFWIGDRS